MTTAHQYITCDSTQWTFKILNNFTALNFSLDQSRRYELGEGKIDCSTMTDSASIKTMVISPQN